MLRVLAICLLFAGTRLAAQCCASECSMPGTVNFGVMEKHHLQAFSFYKHNYSDRFFRGDAPYTYRYYRNIYFDYTGVSLSYGITRSLTAQLDAGYFLNKTQNYYFNNYQLSGRGLADAGLYLRYNIYNGRSLNVTIGGGGKIPTGQFNQTIAGVRLPMEVQSGTGAYEGVALLNCMIKPFRDKNKALLLNSRVQYSGINPSGYQFGFSNSNTLSYTVKLTKKILFLAMVRNEWKACDYYYSSLVANGEPSARFEWFSSRNFTSKRQQANTGSYRFFACPALGYNFGKKWNLTVYGDFPLYQYYNGIQFSARYAFSVSLSKVFDLHKHTKEPAEGEAHHETVD
jgi:hypothetical protein